MAETKSLQEVILILSQCSEVVNAHNFLLKDPGWADRVRDGVTYIAHPHVGLLSGCKAPNDVDLQKQRCMGHHIALNVLSAKAQHERGACRNLICAPDRMFVEMNDMFDSAITYVMSLKRILDNVSLMSREYAETVAAAETRMALATRHEMYEEGARAYAWVDFATYIMERLSNSGFSEGHGPRRRASRR